MQVCDICLGVPDFTGSPMITSTKNRAEEYLFSNKGDINSRRVDLCKECRELFANRSWDKIAERAHDILMLRLGVSEPTTG